ncbi:MAG: 16S rRNA (guanine(527)-N(7))-methyltransferase RsmG [Lachnospiraceae bacterium]|nr:16S rRNA (guanine(527)-N(7))-methyltransferase RsmG [Lachnospiraceae bacterium]
MKDTLMRLSSQMGISLTSEQIRQFEIYGRLLVEWNEKMNLTGITDPVEIARMHFMDSLVGYEEIQTALTQAKAERRQLKLIDVGTGAGFPGLPLKILFPEIRLTLLDSLQKRIHFLEAVGAACSLEQVEYLHGRAEETAQDRAYRETYDVAVARAVAAMPVLMEYCSGYVKKDGIFIAYKGPSLQEELAGSTKAMQVLKLRQEKILRAEVLGEDYHHYVAVFRKTGPLSLQYPRKQSKIKSAPLT